MLQVGGGEEETEPNTYTYSVRITRKITEKMEKLKRGVGVEKSQELRIGGYSHARRTECAKKLVCEKLKTKLAESQFLKRSSCHSIKKE